MTATAAHITGNARALSDLLVVEYGDRIGAAACGSLLAQLGADVVLIEPRRPRSDHKWANRATTAAGKNSIAATDPNDPALDTLFDSADVVLLSSDLSSHRKDWRPGQIVCDITAFGASGPWSGRPYSDSQVQAVSGILDTTGDSANSPVPVGFPILEYCAGIYAAAAIVIALRMRRMHGRGQKIDIALFDCAISALSTFLPFHVIGKPVTRAGNRHSLAAPWNSYRAADGWVMICTGTDEQWQRLCKVMQRPDLASATGMTTNGERVTRHIEVDALVAQWSATVSVEQCVDQLGAAGIPCGPIATVAQLAGEVNLRHRGMARELHDPVSQRTLFLPGSPLKGSRTPGLAPQRIPLPDEDRTRVMSLCHAAAMRHDTPPHATSAETPPYAGLRVLEIGQFTTAPLVSRQLGAFGANVLKIEPPGGDGSRDWPPGQNGQGYFFTFSNSDKQSLMLDLRDEPGRQQFAKLLADADLLVENLKPGSLARLGFGPDRLAILNPRLVYCGISGFGADSAYPGRPAFDTVVQAMSGFMDLTRSAGTPTKAGISAADIVGGASSLLAILAALEYRDRSGQGQHIDISMQDTAAWVTQSAWNHALPAPSGLCVACADGFAYVEGESADAIARIAKWDHRFTGGFAPARELSRSEFVRIANAAGLVAAPVLTVSQAAISEQAAARQVIVQGIDRSGTAWPLLNSPMRLMATPPHVERAIGKLGEANDDVMANLQKLAG